MIKNLSRFAQAFWLEIAAVVVLIVSSGTIAESHRTVGGEAIVTGKFVGAIIATILSGVFVLCLAIRLIGRATGDSDFAGMSAYYKNYECPDCTKLTNKASSLQAEVDRLKNTIVGMAARID